MKLALTLTFTALIVGTFAISANAQTQSLGALRLLTQVQNATLVIAVQRCRCVTRRWNGTCQTTVCKDRW
jgi:hypothetical protein